MPGNLFVPQDNPWERSMNQMGNFLSQLALLKISQNFREKEAAIQTELKAAEMGLIKEAPPSTGGISSEGIKEPEGGPTPLPQPQKYTFGGQDFYEAPMQAMPVPGAPGYVRLRQGLQSQLIKPTEQFKTLGQYGDYLLQGEYSTGKITATKINETATPNEYRDFRDDFLKKNPNATSGDAATAWQKIKTDQLKEIAMIRIPGYAPAPNMPPGTYFDRRTGTYHTPDGKPVKPDQFPSLYSDFSDLAAGKAALQQLEAQRGKVLAFAETAERNLDIALKLSDKIDRTGTPVINRWLMAGKKSVLGDKDVAEFDAALRVGINEFARVTTTATGGGVTSDQSRKEVEEMLKDAMTPEQIRGVITNVLKPDMANRRAGYEVQRNDILRKMRALGENVHTPMQSPPQAATVVETRRTPDGRVIEKLSDGTIRLQGT